MEENEKRKVLITYGMTSDAMIILTDAPRKAIEDWCRNNYKEMENGQNTYFKTLMEEYYVKVLYDSELDGCSDDIEAIGYNETYDRNDFGARSVCITAGCNEEFEVIRTDAPKEVIEIQIKLNCYNEEYGKVIENPYGILESEGYTVEIIGNQDTMKEPSNVERYDWYDYYNDVKDDSEDMNLLVLKTFITDVDKMVDFKKVTKRRFLESYSYLTEEEYDATRKYFDWLLDNGED